MDPSAAKCPSCGSWRKDISTEINRYVGTGIPGILAAGFLGLGLIRGRWNCDWFRSAIERCVQGSFAPDLWFWVLLVVAVVGVPVALTTRPSLIKKIGKQWWL